jgi:DNA polymerase III gamma/tau subunit
MAKQLWVEKYRPTSIDQYVFRDETQKAQIMSWIHANEIPHLLFSGRAGLGKTALVGVLFTELGVEKSDILELNGSAENGVDDIREKVINFVSTMSFGDMRYVFIDECDYLSVNAQAALRNVIETYSDNARFVFTCNQIHKVIEGIKSRCQFFEFYKLDKEQFTEKAVNVLALENVQIDDIETVETIIDSSYPDLRNCLNLLQQHVVDGRLIPPLSNDLLDTDEYISTAISFFKERKYTDARRLICQNVKPDEFDKLFTFAYKNLQYWATDDETESLAIICIRDAMAKAPLCADPEINISAMFVELERIASGK